MGIVTCGITVSVDGFVAGPHQTAEEPLGVDGELLHRWMFEQAEQHRAELDGILDAGAFVMGRNMFGPVRGEWEGDWRGWWGDEPPYHAPVFVLTHHPREPVEMLGGTTFHFVTDGVEAALDRAREAAGDRNVAVAGGASVVNQCLAAGLIDELWLHIAPMALGSGARLFEGVGRLDLEPLETRGTDLVSHVRYRVRR
ncbi:dihydrofolate reductase family protein [Saccharothrix variisporea]|uniref:Dihydrofolate reductase n=1 Tax=Saccharothrix variisporea TaxID=543527 RepID=A0A495XFD4_9PSEU|nr:dihydrofolate reductase family protein [Saccharothrix variisporea]RKT71524.1 dihydrofolate reductase [Saccharothrix variisporea]